MNCIKRSIEPIAEEPTQAKVSKFMEGDFPYIFRASDSVGHHPEDALPIDPASVGRSFERKIGETPDDFETRSVFQSIKQLIRRFTH